VWHKQGSNSDPAVTRRRRHRDAPLLGIGIASERKGSTAVGAFDEIKSRTHVIAGLVPAIPIGSLGASIIGMAGTSPAMTIPCERNAP
jgi:hypothetical protein